MCQRGGAAFRCAGHRAETMERAQRALLNAALLDDAKGVEAAKAAVHDATVSYAATQTGRNDLRHRAQEADSVQLRNYLESVIGAGTVLGDQEAAEREHVLNSERGSVEDTITATLDHPVYPESTSESRAQETKEARAELKKAFPATRFSVRRGTGTASEWIDVSWEDGPTEEAVRAKLPRKSGTYGGWATSRSYSPEAKDFAAQQVREDPDKYSNGRLGDEEGYRQVALAGQDFTALRSKVADREEWQPAHPYFEDAETVQQWKNEGFEPEVAARWVEDSEPEEAKVWCEIGVESPADAVNWRRGYFEPEDAKVWLEMGVTAKDAAEWVTEEFEAKEAQAWMTAHEDFSNPEYPGEYRGLGITDPGEAADWYNAGMEPAYADEWRNAGFSPAVAASWAEKEFDAEEAAEWAHEGFNVKQADSYRKRGMDASAAAERRSDEARIDRSSYGGAGR